MAVVSCKYDRNGATGESDDRDRNSYTLRFKVEVDSDMAPPHIAQACLSASALGDDNVSIPATWSAYNYKGWVDSNSFARHYKVSPWVEDSKRFWFIDVQYLPLQPNEPPGIENTNPLLRPAMFWMDREVFTRVVDKDIFGKQIVNKCGRVYDEPLEQEETRCVLVVEWNVATIQEVIDENRNFENKVNSATWFGVPAREALCREVTSGPILNENGVTYYRLTYRFAIKESKGAPTDPETKWDREILERGYQHFEKDRDGNIILETDGITKKLAPKNGYPEPVLLDTDGTRLPDGQTGKFTAWQTRRPANFNDLAFM